MAIQASISCGACSLSLQGCVGIAAASALPGAAPIPITRPPAAETAVRMKSRRFTLSGVPVPRTAPPSGLHAGGAMDRATQALIRTATADVGDIRIDVGIRGLRIPLQ